MPQAHIVSRSYHDPRFEELTVNRGLFYDVSPEEAIALTQAIAAPFERVELAWSEEITEAELKEFRSVAKLVRPEIGLNA